MNKASPIASPTKKSDIGGSFFNDHQNAEMKNVQVVARCRPPLTEELEVQPAVTVVDAANKTVKVSFGAEKKKLLKNFQFDKVFGEEETQEQIYDSVLKPMVHDVIEGFNCTLFAYGQTGSGKTHLIEGDGSNDSGAGFVSRAVKSMFDILEAQDLEFTVRVSLLEIYNEELYDMLNTSGDVEKKVKLVDNAKKECICKNLDEVLLEKAADITDIMQLGVNHRISNNAGSNKQRNRVNSIITLHLMVKECDTKGMEVIKTGKLNLVDLAGSEVTAKTSTRHPDDKIERVGEVGKNNRSLLTLTRVITALIEKTYVPYRESKLTRLLQEALGGHSKTCVVATFFATATAVEETLATLEFATRVKAVKNQPLVHSRVMKQFVMKDYLSEIQSLKKQLLLCRKKSGVYVDPSQYDEMLAELQSRHETILTQSAELRASKARCEELGEEQEKLTAMLDLASTALQRTTINLEQTTRTLMETKAELRSMQVDCKVREAVVNEQTVTESSLLHQGNQLQNELLSNQDAVEKLLEKVNALTAKDQHRIAEAGVFVTLQSNTHRDLVGKLENFQARCSGHSVSLFHDVDSIVSKTQKTCSSLLEMLDGIMYSLHSSSQASSDSISNGCDALKDNLASTKTNVETVSEALRGQLSDWVEETNLIMKTAKHNHMKQQEQSESLVAALDHYSSSMLQISNSFSKDQEVNHNEAIECALELKNFLKYTFESFSVRAKQQSSAATAMMQEKAEEIKESIMVVVRKMLQKAAIITNKQVTSSAQVCSDTVQKVGEDLSRLSSLRHSAAEDNKTQLDAVRASIEASKTSVEASVESMNNQGLKAKTCMSAVHASVEHQKRDVESLVKSSIQSVDYSAQNGCNAIDKTVSEIGTIIPTITSASDGVRQAVSNTNFAVETVLNTDAKRLTQRLEQHFDVGAVYAQEQRKSVNTSTNTAITYHQAATANKLVSSGDTPTKVLMTEREQKVLVATRDHTIIKREALKALVKANIPSKSPSSTTVRPDENSFCANTSNQISASPGNIEGNVSTPLQSSTSKTPTSISSVVVEVDRVSRFPIAGCEDNTRHTSPLPSPLPISPSRSPNTLRGTLGEKVSRSPFLQNKKKPITPMKF